LKVVRDRTVFELLLDDRLRNERTGTATSANNQITTIHLLGEDEEILEIASIDLKAD